MEIVPATTDDPSRLSWSLYLGVVGIIGSLFLIMFNIGMGLGVGWSWINTLFCLFGIVMGLLFTRRTYAAWRKLE